MVIKHLALGHSLGFGYLGIGHSREPFDHSLSQLQ